MPASALRSTTLVKRRRLYEDVASGLEAMIRDGALATGDQIPSERELGLRFGVGRTAVREALFHLQKLGVIELRSGERARVTRPTPESVVEGLAGAARHLLAEPDGVRQFQSARTFFEVGLARHAAKHATAADLRELAAALEANRRSIGDLAKFERTDVAFHFVLAVIPRNPIFTADASRGKSARAEPVAALYEQGRVFHVGAFPELEDEMCSEIRSGVYSPDRLDALVWAITELLLTKGPAEPRVRMV